MQLTPDYIAQYEEAYKNPRYGMKSWRKAAYREWLKALPRGDSRGPGDFRHTAKPILADIGCGRGESLAIALDLDFDAVGAEIVPRLCTAHKVVQLGPEGATWLPWGNDVFDAVTCMDVLEHLPEDDVLDAVSEMWRVCRKGGRVLIGVPHMQDGAGLHLTIESHGWWVSMLDDATDGDVVRDWIPQSGIPEIKQPYSFFDLEK